VPIVFTLNKLEWPCAIDVYLSVARIGPGQTVFRHKTNIAIKAL
jgi:hypothetical protein